MPVRPRQYRARVARRFAGLVGVLLATALAAAQPVEPPKAADRAPAFKLPDGTIVFLTKSPDEANPPIEGVYLSPQEYKALLEQSEQLKKLKNAPRPLAPSECQVRGQIEGRGERTVAVLTLTYSFRTTAPTAAVSLGCRKAFPLAAKLDGDKLPALVAGDDGLTAWIESPGEHTLTLDVEVPVGPRGGKAEVGFEIGLPRAAITTLALTPPQGVKKVTVGVRSSTDRPGELKRTTEDVAALAKYPLGPAEALELVWQPPSAAPMATDAPLSAEVEAVVRLDEAQAETTATVRLRGPATEWSLALPPLATVEVRRANSTLLVDPSTEPPFAAVSAGLTHPTAPNQTDWKFRPPDDADTGWDLTVTVRQPRPKADEAKKDESKKPAPFAIGPFAVPTAARLTGTIKVYAPPNVRLSFDPATDVRRQDASLAEEDLAAVFKFTAVGSGTKPPPELLKVQAYPARTFTRVQPSYTLRRTVTGWRLEIETVVTPVRTEVEQLEIELPAGWQSLEAGPLELVEGVQEIENTGAARRYAVQLIAPQKAAFALTLTAALPLPNPAATREATVLLPRFQKAEESAAKLTATVPEGWEVRGTATGSDGASRELKPTNPSARPSSAVTAVATQLEKGVTQTRLTWQQYRPDLIADLRTEVTLGEGQVGITETIRFLAAEGEVKPIRLRGPAGVVGLRSAPGSLPVDPAGPGEWVLRPPADGAREFTLTVTYALPSPPRPTSTARLAVGLLWPESATRIDALVRVFGNGSTWQVARFEGPWREVSPEPSPDRDSLPWLTLAGSGNPTSAPSLPLTLELDRSTDGGPSVEVERTLMQAWQAEDGTVAIRGRFRLRRWMPVGVDVELPPGVVPEIVVDSKQVDPVPHASEPNVVRVPIPEPRAGRSVLLDIRYMLPVVRTTAIGELTLRPPRLSDAVFRSPPRWQVVLPSSAVLLDTGRAFQPDLRWGLRRGLPAPVAAASTEELDRWIADGTDPNADGQSPLEGGPAAEAMIGSQPSLAPVTLVRVGRTQFAAACSLLVLALGLAVARLRPVFIGPTLAVVGVATAILAAWWPQPTAQAAAAALPGLVGLVVVLGGLAAVRWYYRRRVQHLPGFTRAPAPVSGTGSAPATPTGSRSSPTGSAEVVLEGTTGSHHPQPTSSGS